MDSIKDWLKRLLFPSQATEMARLMSIRKKCTKGGVKY